MITNFVDGNIFKIASRSRPNLIYIGKSSRINLDKVLEQYNELYQLYLVRRQKYLKCFDIMKYNDCYIELLENCDDINKLMERELYYIQTIDCINKVKSFTVNNSANAIECECGATYSKNYKFHHQSIRHITYSNKIYDEREEMNYVIEQPKMVEQNIIVAEEPKQCVTKKRNKPTDKEYYKNEMVCECGTKLRRLHLKDHLKSNNHKVYLKSLEQAKINLELNQYNI